MRRAGFPSSILLALAAVAAPCGVRAGRPVARWDVVPFQTVSGNFKVGVVAFHERAVKVEFRVFGKPRTVATKPELNERTGVVEYVYDFPAKRFRDGIVEIEATVTAEGEDPYSLPSLPLYANARGKIPPGATVWADSASGNDFAEGAEQTPVKTLARAVGLAGSGGTVYLKPGKYTLRKLGGGLDRKYWTLVTCAPGVPREAVSVSGGRTGTEKLHFKGLDIHCDVASGYGTAVMGEGGKTMAWFDDCTFSNLRGRHAATSVPFGNKLRAFVTGGSTHDMSMGPNAEILRGHSISRIASTAASGSDCLVANCTIEDVDPGSADDIPDLFNAFAAPPHWAGDVIVYGVKARNAKCRAIACQQLTDSAFVDVAFEGLPGGLAYSRFSEGLENVIFDRVSMKGQRWQWMTAKIGRGSVKPRDVIVRGCEMASMEGFEPLDGTAGIKVENCTAPGAR